MEALRTKLADLSHDIWSGWMIYMFAKGTFNPDGTWTMPKWAVDRWNRQAISTVNYLPKDEQKSDYSQADKIMEVLQDEH